MDDDSPAAQLTQPLSVARLQPLPYHRNLVEYLRANEPEVWRWASSLEAQEQHSQEVRTQLLRQTYRLTREGHANVYAICDRATQRLGIDAPVTLYQGGDGPMNAMLYFLLGEPHIVLTGPVLERLGEDELAALFGHELAHYLLWSRDGGQYYTADRILNHTLADPGASRSQAQTSRLLSLYTEVYADRGAAVAAESALPAISTLVKVQTGLPSVDPLGYLKQAAELIALDGSVSAGHSHPETYLRAQALQMWSDAPEAVEPWLEKRIEGALQFDQLDLLGQRRLTALTRRFMARFLAPEWLRSERVLIQARSYFPDWRSDEPTLEPAELASTAIDDATREYLGCVLLDLALADVDLRDEALVEALRFARGFESEASLIKLLRKEAGLTKREVDKLSRRAAKTGAAA